MEVYFIGFLCVVAGIFIAYVAYDMKYRWCAPLCRSGQVDVRCLLATRAFLGFSPIAHFLAVTDMPERFGYRYVWLSYAYLAC